MVDLSERNGTVRESLDRANSAIAEALAKGVDARELLDMVTTVASEQLEIPGLFPDLNEEEPIYTDTEVPEGLIDLPRAARKYGHRIARLQRWVQRGHLKVYGRLKAPARGGGYLLLNEGELLERMSAPPNKGGRPQKPSLN